MTDPLNVIVVGHHLQHKCDVANALIRKKNLFRQFECNKLIIKKATDFTYHGGVHPKIILTPSIGTPIWQQEVEKLSHEQQYRKKCMVYVKDLSSVRVNDIESIKGIGMRKLEPIVVVIPYYTSKNQVKVAEQEKLRFEKHGWRTELLKLPVSALERTPFSTKMFNLIRSIYPEKEDRLNKSLTESSVIGRRVGKKDFSLSLTDKRDEYAEKQMKEQIASVNREEKQDIRPSTPPGNVKLTANHWETYKKALTSGKTKSYHTRVNIVGYQAAGKTTLVRRLQEIDLKEEKMNLPTTECLEINKSASRCLETPNGRLWETHPLGYEKDLNHQRMAASLHSTNLSGGTLNAGGSLQQGTRGTKEEDGETSEEKITEGQIGTDTGKNIENTDKEQTATGINPDTDSHIESTDKVTAGAKGPDSESGNTTLNVPLVDELYVGSDEIYEIEESPETDPRNTFNWNMYATGTIKMDYLNKVFQKATHSPGHRRFISYWDFAGQATYYTTHQAFLAPAAVYLLVVNLNQPLNLQVEDSMEFRNNTYQNTTILDAVRFWAGSIKSFASDKNNTIAPLIVVGTHADEVRDPDDIEETFKTVREIIGESDLSCIAIDNTKSYKDDEQLHELRDRIVDMALGIIEKEVPAHWIDLEYMIILEKEKGEVIITFKEVEALNRRMDEPLKKEDLLGFLEHEHCNGFLMFFNDNKDIIILQPSVLVDFINIIMSKTRRDSLPGRCCDGMFDQVFLNHAAATDEKLSKYKYELLQLLTHLKVVFPKEITSTTSEFFMPCLLGERPDKRHIYDEGKCKMSPLIRISFNGKLVPPAFFHSLVVSLLFAWSLDSEQDLIGVNKMQVFYHYVRFKLSENGGTLLEMFWSESQIFLKFIHLSKFINFQDMDCLSHLDTIKDKVKEILKTYRHQHIECVFDIACTDKSHECFISLADLKKNKEARCSGGIDKHVHMVKGTDILSSWVKMGDSDQKTSTTEDFLPDEVRNRQVTEKEMVEISGNIGTEYQRLFILLGIKFNTIQIKIDSNRSNVTNTILHLLMYWRDEMADEATVGSFLRNMERLGINERLLWHIFRQ